PKSLRVGRIGPLPRGSGDGMRHCDGEGFEGAGSTNRYPRFAVDHELLGKRAAPAPGRHAERSFVRNPSRTAHDTPKFLENSEKGSELCRNPERDLTAHV